MGSFSEYFDGAMHTAVYEEMEEDEGWFGTIPGFDGLWASGPSEEDCGRELRSTLEDWVLFSLQRQMAVPTVNGIELNLQPSEAA